MANPPDPKTAPRFSGIPEISGITTIDADVVEASLQLIKPVIHR